MGEYQRSGGFQGADAWADAKKNNTAATSTHTIMACRPTNSMHWKIPFNWMDNGGQPTQIDNATTEMVSSALGLHASVDSSIESLEQADWAMIIEKIFLDSQKRATKTNVLLDNKEIIKR